MLGMKQTKLPTLRDLNSGGRTDINEQEQSVLGPQKRDNYLLRFLGDFFRKITLNWVLKNK
jgi:hypothetical protein